MRGRGVLAMSDLGFGLMTTVAGSLSFMLAWPVLGAGQSGEDQRVAMSLALHVDVSATTVVGAPLG
jgi:hypothetical protein